MSNRPGNAPKREREIVPGVVQRTRATMLVGQWSRSGPTGPNAFSMAFRRERITVHTPAAGGPPGGEIVATETWPDLQVDMTDDSTVIDAGTDPETGADLSSISKPGIAALLAALYEHESDAE